MTNKARQVIVVMARLEERDDKTGNDWFEASRIAKLYTEIFEEITTMQISAILTHMKRERLVERQAATDKKFAWWRRTTKGKEVVNVS